MPFECLDCCQCSRRPEITPEEVEAAEAVQRSKEIDKQISKQKLKFRREVKLLLLGASESGKSTFVKQMKIINGFEFDDRQLLEFRTVIYCNVVLGIKVLIEAQSDYQNPWTSRIAKAYAENIVQMDEVMLLDPEVFCENAYMIEKLWSEPAIKKTYTRRAEYQLGDSLKYFLDSISTISKLDYLPSTTDILHCRHPTKGIAEYQVTVNDVPFRFVDVGGQRTQRQKWFSCFDSVTSILFLVSSSEYDQKISEDNRTNRVVESLNIFETIVNHKAFKEVSMILFLNKTDLLVEKLNALEAIFNRTDNAPHCSSKTPSPDPLHQPHPHAHHRHRNRRIRNFKHYFSDFDGDPFSCESIQDYMLTMFKKACYNPKKPIYHHFTTAVDTENIKHVFDDVTSTILQKNITLLMLH